MNYKELCIFFIFCLFLPSITQIHNHLDETPEIEKITVFIMDKKPVNFLSEEDLLNLDLYEYHSGEYSFLDNILNPFWQKVAYAFPNWFAPNLITLTGLIINIVAALIVALYDPMLTGEAPGWVYINAAICLQVYGILDAADGKQARRIHASSPLGQIFDHGCDAVNLIFIIISSCSGIGLRIGKTTSYTIIMMCGCFACAQLLEYQTNILVAGSKVFGVTEAMLIVSITLILSGIFGTQIWDLEMTTYMPFLKTFKEECPLKYVVCILLDIVVMISCVLFLLQGLIKESPIPVEKRGNKNVDRASYLFRFVPVLY